MARQGQDSGRVRVRWTGATQGIRMRRAVGRYTWNSGDVVDVPAEWWAANSEELTTSPNESFEVVTDVDAADAAAGGEEG